MNALLASNIRSNSTPEPNRVLGLSILILALLAGGALRLWVCLHDDGIFAPDEIFQSLEPAHIQTFGYGLTAWEFVVGARHWALPGLISWVLHLCVAVGLGEPRQYILVVRLLFTAASTATAYGAYRLARASGAGTLPAAIGASFCAMSGLLIFLGPRTLSDVAVELPVTLGFALAIDPRDDRRRVGLGAALLGTAVMFRLQMVFFCASALLILVARRRWDGVRTALAVFLLWAFLFGLIDKLTWGSWFHSAVVYLNYNLVKGVAARYGVSSATFFFRTLWGSTFLTGLLTLLLMLWGLPVAPGPGVTALLFIAVHSLEPHKELRFIVPALPLCCAAAGVGLQRIFDRSTHLGRRVAAGSLAAALGSAIGFRTLTLGDIGRQGPPDRPIYDLGGSINRLLFTASGREDLCGLRLVDILRVQTGGYAYLHRRVPFYGGRQSPPTGAYNYVISTREQAHEGTLMATDGEYALERIADSCVPDPNFSWQLNTPPR